LWLICLCWEPVLSLLRQGQSALLIGSLLVLGWYLLRRGREGAAGIPIGVATCLKLYPGLLLVYLLLRYRRAFVSAVASIAVLAILPLPFTGLSLFRDYSGIAPRVTAMYGGHPLNLSLLGLLRKNGLNVPSGAFAVLAAAIAAGAVLLIWKSGVADKFRLEHEYALFCALALLLSPIAWDHYLVILIFPLVVLGNSVLNPKPEWPSMIGFALLAMMFAIPAISLIFPFATQQQARFVNIRTASILNLALIAFIGWSARVRFAQK
jgi:hypothetical protein